MLSFYLLVTVTAIYTGIGIAVCICLVLYSDEIEYNVLIPVAVIFCTLTSVVCFLFFYLIKQTCSQSFLPVRRQAPAATPPAPPKPPSPFPPIIVEHPGGELVVAIYEDNPSPPQ